MITSLVPRWYQEECVNAFFNYFEQHDGNPLFAIPTGAGKSLIIAMLSYAILSNYPGQRIVVATHVKELITQDYKELIKVWPQAPAGIYSAGLKRKDLFFPITFAGIASIVKIIEAFGHVDLFFIDEAHLLGPNADSNYMKVILALKAINPKMKVIGLTATPFRTGMGLLTNGDIFTDIPYNICTIDGFKRLFADGHLVPPRVKRVDTEMEYQGLSISNGEFSTGEQTRRAVGSPEIMWKALNESLNKNPDRNCRLVFNAGIEDAMLAAEMLRYIGLRCQAVHSKMSDAERDGIMNAFYAGELDALTNNGIATTGINHKPIDHIISLRATMSVGLWVQKVGRGMRPCETDGWVKTDCIVSDHGGNAKRLGPIDDPYIPKMKGKTAGDAPLKICEACDSYNHTSARVCVYCGEPFSIKVGYKPTAFDDVIIRSDLPEIETFEVSNVFYTQYIKRNATPETKPTIKATYNCGVRSFIEYVPIESAAQLPFRKATEWWTQRFPEGGFRPKTVAEAMPHVDRLVPPKAIKVWVNKRWPEIVGYEY